MDPSNPENLEVVLNADITQQEKARRLAELEKSRQRGKGTLPKLVSAVIRLAAPALEQEASAAEVGDTSQTSVKGPNHTASRRLIQTADSRELELELFAFAPSVDGPYSSSITASWFEPGAKTPFYREHVSGNMFDKDCAAYEPTAGVMLGIIAASVEAYEEAA